MPRDLIEKDDLLGELIKNNIMLQKSSVELISNINKLITRVDRMLALFEEAAKKIESAEGKEPLAKQLEALLEQNKTIARGLVLIEKYIRDKTTTGFSPLKEQTAEF